MKDIKPNEKLQLEFISFIQRILSEGDFVATYKYALLNAIADICIEKLYVSANESLKIEHSLLAEKLLQLYWHHAMPFSEHKSGSDALLKQNAGAQSKVITVLYECQQNNIRNLVQLKRSSHWLESYRAALNTLKTGPLWRLQILAKQEECFLYPHNKKLNYIELKPGMLFTIEPMVNLGRPHVKVLRDGWTAVTRDRSLSAQFEHSVGITDTGVEVFTVSPTGQAQPPYNLER